MADKKDGRQDWATVALLLIAVYAALGAFAISESENGTHTSQDYLIAFLWGFPFLMFLLYGIIQIIQGDFSSTTQVKPLRLSIVDSMLLSLLCILFGIIGFTISATTIIFQELPQAVFFPTIVVTVVFCLLVLNKLFK